MRGDAFSYGCTDHYTHVRTNSITDSGTHVCAHEDSDR